LAVIGLLHSKPRGGKIRDGMENKSLATGILLIPALAIAYYFAIALPENQRASLAFEKQKYADQQKREREQAQKKEEDAQARRSSLSTCLYLAEQESLADVTRNGKPARNGLYSVEVSVGNAIQRRKEHAIAECHRQFGN
jgi:hypothetical protein